MPPGTHLGRIKASDPDMGTNAEVQYNIAEGDGADTFEVVTDKDTQEGIITVKKVPSHCVHFFTESCIVFSCISVKSRKLNFPLYYTVYLSQK